MNARNQGADYVHAGEALGRTKKVARLVAVAVLERLTADDLIRYTDRDWDGLAIRARTKPPSTDTRRMVCWVLRDIDDLPLRWMPPLVDEDADHG